MIPEFDGDGSLPAGCHLARWKEVWDFFAWSPRRRVLLAGLRQVLQELARCGCSTAWLDGSFVTSKGAPGDFDLVWDPDGVDLDSLDDVLTNELDPPRKEQHDRYGGDVLPNVIEGGSGMPFLDFFQQDPVTGRTRGIVELNLEEFR